MIVSFQYPAGRYTLFTKEAAKSMIGQTFTAKHEQMPIGEGTVLDAEVIDGGSAINLTVEWPDDPVLKREMKG